MSGKRSFGQGEAPRPIRGARELNNEVILSFQLPTAGHQELRGQVVLSPWAYTVLSSVSGSSPQSFHFVHRDMSLNITGTC